MHKIKRSPLFYVWDKYKLLEEIKQYLPQNIDSFVEPFLWGWSPFLNIEAKSYILNDIDSNIYKIHKFLLSKTDHFIINNIKTCMSNINPFCNHFPIKIGIECFNFFRERCINIFFRKISE